MCSFIEIRELPGKDKMVKIKLFLNIGIQIRLLRNLEPTVVVANKRFHAIIHKMESGKVMK